MLEELEEKAREVFGTLSKYLNEKIFAGNSGSKIEPDPESVKGFDKYMERYLKGLAAERAALDI